MRQYIHKDSYINLNPSDPTLDMDDLRRFLKSSKPDGDAFLNYLLQDDYFSGKGIWVNSDPDISATYRAIIESDPTLQSQSPYGDFFNKDSVRVQGDNPVLISNLSDAPKEYQALYNQYLQETASKKIAPAIVFAGGPAAKIASLLAAKKSETATACDLFFISDGTEQSNESASASYEHVNHANALNAEHDNTGLGILISALRRAFFAERNPDAALHLNYRKVDLWPAGVHMRDLPIYVVNEVHGWTQKLRSLFGKMNEHDKSRLASKYSTKILDFIERDLGISLRLVKRPSRAFFLYLSETEHTRSIKERKVLSKFVQLLPEKVSEDTIRHFYGDGNLKNIVSADIFSENNCIDHGFDAICRKAMIKRDIRVLDRTIIKELFFSHSKGRSNCVGLRCQDIITKEVYFLPLSYLGLTLGPTATYEFSKANTPWEKLCDRIKIKQPVPHQTIATGCSAQILCRVDEQAGDWLEHLPHTGLKQTHIVEIARHGPYILFKLTAGGNIGLPWYSRSYGISALANFSRVWPPGCGIVFVDVICAWPGIRGVNASNNGQLVRLADNAVVRFGEGGTGMSKMGANAQTMLDMLDISHQLPENEMLPRTLYAHTVIDNRRPIRRRLHKPHLAR
ncbi:hypothetical protein [Candidatus Marimicrobium litorale]|uniref:Uncharacterized protein n=1 Tax=Candidatus Marimicrobium litorale TaxID=2518991 RepID=A0ABT3T9F6_9GAMM|nr:hypothetical protein [Candidatus Marimicrobium litorale]MCX2978918.1 hypothetical protein [Candidatus Marimicrobium litorale]